MANSKSAEKRARQNISRYELKHAQRYVVRTAMKNVNKAVETKDAKIGDIFKISTVFKHFQHFLIFKDF